MKNNQHYGHVSLILSWYDNFQINLQRNSKHTFYIQ